MKIPNTLTQLDGRYHNTAEDVILDFAEYQQVRVRNAYETYQGQPNACIDNSLEFGEFGDLDIVQGYITLCDNKIGIFHYWNRCPETGTYWDCSPVTDIKYYVKKQT